MNGYGFRQGLLKEKLKGERNGRVQALLFVGEQRSKTQSEGE